MTLVLETIVPVFGIVALGYWLARCQNPDVATLSNLALTVTSPALIFRSLAAMDFRKPGWLEPVGGAFCIALCTGLVAWAIARKRPELRGFVLAATFWNAGNLPLPCCQLAFGEAGLQAATLVFVAMGLMHSTAGIWIAKGAGGGGEALRNPLFLAFAAGVTVSLTGTKLPSLLATPIDMLAQMAIPLMLLTLGIQLRSLSVVDLHGSLQACAVRFGMGLLVATAFVTALPVSEMTRKVLLLHAVMPSAVINYVIARRYGSHPGLVASTIVFSTLLAAITIPTMLAFLGSGT